MNKRKQLSSHAFFMLAGLVLVSGSVAARPDFHGEQTIRLPLAGGEVEVHRPRLKEEPSTERGRAPGAPIGTTTGDDVSSPVRTVRFESRTTYPEARAEIDYGRGRPLGWPREHDLLGLEVERVDSGSRIVAVERGSEADRAGLEPWDVIVRLDTENRPTPRTVRRILRDKQRGSYVFLRIRRGPHELAVKIRA